MALDTRLLGANVTPSRRRKIKGVGLVVSALVAGVLVVSLGSALRKVQSALPAIDFLIQPGGTIKRLTAHVFNNFHAFQGNRNWPAVPHPAHASLEGYQALASSGAVEYGSSDRQYGTPREHATDSLSLRPRPGHGVGIGRRELGLSAGLIATMAWAEEAQAVSIAELELREKQQVNLFESVTPSVVYINTFMEGAPASPSTMEVPQGAGSGFVWDKDGHIVTNFHVIRNSQSALITLTDEDGKKTEYNAKLSGYDVDQDIAVLKVDAPASKLRPILVGASNQVKVGQVAYAIGNPFGLDHTLTAGVVSGLGRQVMSLSGRPIQNAIQTDASINPGNSGGPLLNLKGQMVGVNTGIYSATGSSAGVGFAIPVDSVKQVVTSIIAQGRVIRPAIGIQFFDPAKAQALFKYNGISSGILIEAVMPDSPAARAGLRGTEILEDGRVGLGDIITQIDDAEIKKEQDLFNAIDTKKVGQEVNIKVLRTEDFVKTENETSVEVVKRFIVDVNTVLIEKKGSSSLTSSINREARERLNDIPDPAPNGAPKR